MSSFNEVLKNAKTTEEIAKILAEKGGRATPRTGYGDYTAFLNKRWNETVEVEKLKVTLQELVEGCPLVPDLTALGLKERAIILVEHSVKLNEWYHKLKTILDSEKREAKPNE